MSNFNTKIMGSHFHLDTFDYANRLIILGITLVLGSNSFYVQYTKQQRGQYEAGYMGMQKRKTSHFDKDEGYSKKMWQTI